MSRVTATPTTTAAMPPATYHFVFEGGGDVRARWPSGAVGDGGDGARAGGGEDGDERGGGTRAEAGVGCWRRASSILASRSTSSFSTPARRGLSGAAFR